MLELQQIVAQPSTYLLVGVLPFWLMSASSEVFGRSRSAWRCRIRARILTPLSQIQLWLLFSPGERVQPPQQRVLELKPLAVPPGLPLLLIWSQSVGPLLPELRDDVEGAHR